MKKKNIRGYVTNKKLFIDIVVDIFFKKFHHLTRKEEINLCCNAEFQIFFKFH